MSKTYHFFLKLFPKWIANSLTIMFFVCIILAIFYCIPFLIQPIIYWG